MKHNFSAKRINFILLLLALSLGVKGFARLPESIKFSANDDIRQKHGWMFKAGYNRQSKLNWAEFGIGRINLLSYHDPNSSFSFSAGAVAFTAGADLGFGDTSLIIAPKLGMEAHLTLVGARISYGYFMQDDEGTGVICVEGGLCVMSVFYLYGGYNIATGHQINPVMKSGGRFSVGVNIPFGLSNAVITKDLGMKSDYGIISSR